MDNQLFKTDVEVKKAIESIKANVEEILASNSKDYYEYNKRLFIFATIK